MRQHGIYDSIYKRIYVSIGIYWHIQARAGLLRHNFINDMQLNRTAFKVQLLRYN